MLFKTIYLKVAVYIFYLFYHMFILWSCFEVVFSLLVYSSTDLEKSFQCCLWWRNNLATVLLGFSIYFFHPPWTNLPTWRGSSPVPLFVRVSLAIVLLGFSFYFFHPPWTNLPTWRGSSPVPLIVLLEFLTHFFHPPWTNRPTWRGSSLVSLIAGVSEFLLFLKLDSFLLTDSLNMFLINWLFWHLIVLN